MSTPRYVEIADYLRDLVAGSRLGDLLPSDAELCERFDVSRMTARHAVQLLVNEGLVHRERGKGTFVSARRTLGSPMSFTASMRERGMDVDSDVIESGEVTTTVEEADALRLEADSKTVVLTRLRRAGGIPMAIERAVLHPDVAEAADNARGSLHSAFEKLGRTPTHALSRVTARLATERERSLLGMTDDAVVVCERQLTTDPLGRPLEVTETVYAAERYEFEAVIELGGGEEPLE